jgi:hypothetical protein
MTSHEMVEKALTGLDSAIASGAILNGNLHQDMLKDQCKKVGFCLQLIV